MNSRGVNLVHSSVPGLQNVPCPHLQRDVSHRGTVTCRVIQRGHDYEGQGSCPGSSEGSLGARLCLKDPREIPSSGGGPWCVVKSEGFWSQMDKVVSALSVQGSPSPPALAASRRVGGAGVERILSFPVLLPLVSRHSRGFVRSNPPGSQRGLRL